MVSGVGTIGERCTSSHIPIHFFPAEASRACESRQRNTESARGSGGRADALQPTGQGRRQRHVSVRVRVWRGIP